MIDTGWQPRLEILKRDAEHSIIAPLKTHGWIVEIIEEVKNGDTTVQDDLKTAFWTR